MPLSSSSVIMAAERQTDCPIYELVKTNRSFQALLVILGAINHHGKGSENRRLETSPKSCDGRALTCDDEDETAPSPAGLLFIS